MTEKFSRYTIRQDSQGGWGVWDHVLNRFAVTRCPAETVEDSRQSMARDTRATAELVDGVALFTLATDSGERAYAYTQTAEEFHDGDVVKFANVVAIMFEAWPIALTRETREFHPPMLAATWQTTEGGKYADAYRVAKPLADAADRAGDPRFITGCGTPITDGIVLWDHNCARVRVDVAGSNVDKPGWDGWFRVVSIYDDNARNLVNASQLSSVHPMTGEQATPPSEYRES